MSQPGFWDNQERAQQSVGRLKSLKGVTMPLDSALGSVDQLGELVEFCQADPGMASEVASEVERLEELAEKLELKALLSGPHDSADAILSIHARDGGLDANDWAEMMLRMYLMWAESADFQVELLDRQDNEGAGISQATLAIRGDNAYGYLKGEEGMHRLVRISPFNSEGKRQTSFAAIDVSPDIDDTVEINIRDEDVREDTFRASGAGGQHVNKTSSAIRLTHLPSGVVVQCQNDRSQHKNRASAYKMLRARLARLEEEKREAEQAAKYQGKARVGFGSQIRNYFMHPDQRVKDARSGYSVTQFHEVLDGKLQPFLDAYLRWRAKEESDMAMQAEA
jgi:peptide chain release factor 2